MARVHLGRNIADERIVALIWGTAAARGLNNEQIGARAKLSRATVCRRRKQPEDITLGELRSIGRALGIPIEELREAIRY